MSKQFDAFFQPLDYQCAHCYAPAQLARREYKVGDEVRYHVGIYCAKCDRFTLPWLKQKPEHKDLPIVDVEGAVALRDLLNPKLFE